MAWGGALVGKPRWELTTSKADIVLPQANGCNGSEVAYQSLPQECPSTVLLRHTDTYAEGRSWVVLGSTPDDNIRNR